MNDNMLPIPTPEKCAQDLRDDGFHPEATLVERMAREASYHQQEVVGLVEKSRMWQERAEKAEALFAQSLVHIRKITAERDQALSDLEADRERSNEVHKANEELSVALHQALAASAAREIAMRDRAAASLEEIYGGTWPRLGETIRALPLSPDGQQALDDVRANAWDEGYDQALKDDFGSKGYTQNPYRKPSDAGKSEDRG